LLYRKFYLSSYVYKIRKSIVWLKIKKYGEKEDDKARSCHGHDDAVLDVEPIFHLPKTEHYIRHKSL